MALNKVKGNMYDWVSHTWNTVKGECPHGCHYCYMKRWGEQKPVRFDEKELKTDLGNGNTIFVGSSCDMWAAEIDREWIWETLKHIQTYWGNSYVFQSKNPDRFLYHQTLIPRMSRLGTTIESNRWLDEMGDSPPPRIRAKAIYDLSRLHYRTFVTIEPIMDFDLDAMDLLIKQMRPEQVNIGANTNHQVKLPEPSADKIKALVEAIEPFTKVKLKPNLKRIMA